MATVGSLAMDMPAGVAAGVSAGMVMGIFSSSDYL